MRTWYAESHPLVSFADGCEECAALLSQLLINGAGANVRSDLCEEKGACANIALAAWVSFYSLSSAWLQELLPHLDCWTSCCSMHQVKRCPKFLMYVSSDVFPWPGCFVGDPWSSWFKFVLYFFKFKVILHGYTLHSLGKSVGFLLLELDTIYSSPWVSKGYSLAFPLWIFVVLRSLMDGALNYLAFIKFLLTTPKQTLVLHDFFLNI